MDIYKHKDLTEQLDKVFTEGVYGWKVDQGEQHLPASFETSKGRMTNEEFRHYYYQTFCLQCDTSFVAGLSGIYGCTARRVSSA